MKTNTFSEYITYTASKILNVFGAILKMFDGKINRLCAVFNMSLH